MAMPWSPQSRPRIGLGGRGGGMSKPKGGGTTKTKQGGRSQLSAGVVASGIGELFGLGQDYFRNQQLNEELARRERKSNAEIDATTDTQYAASNEAQFNASNKLDAANAALVGGQQSRTADLLNNYSDAERDIYGEYDKNLKSAMSDLEGLGTAERENIDRTFKANEGTIGQNLADRGLTASTVMPSLKIANAGEKARAQGALGEQLRRERIGVTADLGDRRAAALERIRGSTLGAKTGLTGEQLQYGDQAATRRIGSDLGFHGERTGIEQNRFGNKLGIINANQYLPTGPGPADYGGAISSFGNTLTAARAEAYDPPSANTWLGPTIGATGTVGGLGLAAGIMKSSKKLKTDRKAVSHEAILKRVRDMPVGSWRYKGDTERHVGPMAEDHAKVSGGSGDNIPVVDAIGNLYAAVKALDRKVSKRG